MKQLFKRVAALAAILLLAGTVAWAQKQQVTGRVTEAATGEPVPGAAILVKGGTGGVITDASGAYSIQVASDATLVCTLIGYTDMEQAVGGRAEIDFALAQEADAGRLVKLMAAGEMPERATHNDTKINNVLLDDKTGEGICVIDLDTLMPGSALYDFGDMVRSATLNMAEDSKDYLNVVCRADIFEALARGFLAGGDFLTPVEKANMAFGGMLMTLECGVRFLTDYLDGDHYFKIHRPEHNLDRCRTQFALVQSILDQHDRLQGFADAL